VVLGGDLHATTIISNSFTLFFGNMEPTQVTETINAAPVTKVDDVHAFDLRRHMNLEQACLLLRTDQLSAQVWPRIVLSQRATDFSDARDSSHSSGTFVWLMESILSLGFLQAT
jgi:hypothetical protein